MAQPKTKRASGVSGLMISMIVGGQLIGNGVRGSHHGLAATAIARGRIQYATGIGICDVANPCTDGSDHTFF